MNIDMRNFLAANSVALMVLATFLGGSDAGAESLSATYKLIEVNGEKLPAVSWATDEDGKHCEFLTVDGALMLSLEGRAGAFALERVNCSGEDGSKSSTLSDFVMFTGPYEISGKQISISWSEPPDLGTLSGGRLILIVVGVGEYAGQTTEYSFQKFQQSPVTR